MGFITDLLAIKTEEMSEQQLIYERQIQKRNPTVNLFSPTYTDVSKTLDSEMKRLKAKGLGMTVNKAEPISLEKEELLWESGALGDINSMTLS